MRLVDFPPEQQQLSSGASVPSARALAPAAATPNRRALAHQRRLRSSIRCTRAPCLMRLQGPALRLA